MERHERDERGREDFTLAQRCRRFMKYVSLSFLTCSCIGYPLKKGKPESTQEGDRVRELALVGSNDDNDDDGDRVAMAFSNPVRLSYIRCN